MKPHVHEMVVIHRVFRRESAVLPRLVAATPPGDLTRARRVGAAVRDYVEGLHHHHQLEDDLIWPRLRARARLYDDLVTRMEQQHDRLDGTLTAIDAMLPRWTADAAPEVRAAVIDALAMHREVLLDHLDDEETLVLPLIADHLTADEWDEMGRRGLETVPRARVMLALGAVLEDATAAERRHFLAKAPPAGRLLWRLVGRRQYQRHVRSLRGA